MKTLYSHIHWVHVYNDFVGLRLVLSSHSNENRENVREKSKR